jgi:glycosyltransferase involved in cell wall biosynthesis
MKPNISVIIPTFNRISLLKKTISTVLNQTYKDFEIIIIDNYSTDGTLEYLKKLKDKKINFYQIKNNGIIAKSRNFGIVKSLGEYIAFLDDDDWWDENKLLETTIKLNEGFDLVYHNVFLHGKKIKKSNCRLLKKPIFDDLFCNGNPILTSSVIVKKKLLFDVGKMSEEQNLIASEDYDTWLKIAKKTNKFCLIKKCLGHYLVSEKSFWRKNDNIEKIFINLDQIIQNHKNDYSHDIKNITWVDYLKAKYLSEKGDFKKSNFYLKELSKKNINLNIKIKLIYFFFKNLFKFK